MPTSQWRPSAWLRDSQDVMETDRMRTLARRWFGGHGGPQEAARVCLGDLGGSTGKFDI